MLHSKVAISRTGTRLSSPKMTISERMLWHSNNGDSTRSVDLQVQQRRVVLTAVFKGCPFPRALSLNLRFPGLNLAIKLNQPVSSIPSYEVEPGEGSLVPIRNSAFFCLAFLFSSSDLYTSNISLENWLYIQGNKSTQAYSHCIILGNCS
jgi:hypothetical protein